MYIPIDPQKSEDYWGKLEKSLESNKLSYIIIDGKSIENTMSRCLSSTDVSKLISRLKLMDYVRLGSNHNNLMPCHFTLKLNKNKQEALLQDLIARDNSFEQINDDLFFIIDFSFFEIPTLKILRIPMKMETISISSEFKIEIDKEFEEIKITKKYNPIL